MEPAEAHRRLASARRATLATVGGDGRPHLVPVVFALVPGGVVTAVDQKPKRTRRLRRLDNITADPRVCLLVDDYGDDWESLWWVRVDGHAEILPDGPKFREALAALMTKYPQYRREPPGGPVIWITVERLRGWSGAT